MIHKLQKFKACCVGGPERYYVFVQPGFQKPTGKNTKQTKLNGTAEAREEKASPWNLLRKQEFFRVQIYSRPKWRNLF